jgi:hypothetical protein
MTRRITERDLYDAVARLNELAHGEPKPAHNAPGAYFLQGAYGGWQLQRNAPNGRGCESVTHGYVNKPALYDLIYAYRKGYETAQRDRHAQVFGHSTAPAID